MFCHVLPQDVKDCIVNYMRPEKFTLEGVRMCARVVISWRGDEKKLQILKQIYELVIEYSNYNRHAARPEDFWNRMGLNPSLPYSQSISPLINGSPHLFTAISKGHYLFDNNYKHSFYNFRQENDIIKIVKLIPESVNFLFGDSKVYSCFMTPLEIACLNDKIPLYMIEFLLRNGAKTHVPCKGERKTVFLINHLGWGVIGAKRLEAIGRIFAKFRKGS